ncbi:sodium/potassium-transporting ATPase subunit beta-2-like isoform X1 [Cydia strobilella]|uniref:sodium/potassium-transporting ATPase subunit beta-2-like isoform X1 n=1 Tax=Cydia strobilella TaxID=1100964 RepID=UPI003004ED5E
MGLEKRTIKIIVIVVVAIVILGGLLGLLLGLLLYPYYVVLEVWPRSVDDYRWDQPLIQFRPADPGSFHPWIQRTNDFLRVYETMVPESPPRAPCTTRERMHTMPRPPDCDQAMRRWDPCTIDMGYGYPMGTPCVFLRLSHVNYWTPHPYNYSMNLHIPPEMPKHIRDGMAAANGMDYIWVSCQGEFGADKENIGPIHYITGGLPPGFPLSRLHTADRIPYASRHLPEKDPGPLVGVFFKEPRRGVVINVECRIWARDIYYDGTGRTGRARFEIFVE